MTLANDIEEIRLGIRNGRFRNEAAVSQGVVLRLLGGLGWKTFDTTIVIPEYSINGLRVDFALCHPPGKPVIFIEVKQIGQSTGAEQQLFQYAFHKGVPMAILTDGQEWNFFLPGEQGDYGERRVYSLDLSLRDTQESVDRLKRYLGFERVISGVALKDAREDYQSVAKQREMFEVLPKAWDDLLRNEDEMLIEILADRVERLCGFRPGADLVAQFLQRRFLPAAALPHGIVESLPVGPDKFPQTNSTSQVRFRLNGRWHSARDGIDVLRQVFELLADADESFLERFGSVQSMDEVAGTLLARPKSCFQVDLIL